ncbi:MAG TPA: hypothetical protein VLF43_03725, partial [Candidatus Saccharimonadales bacterium]|nr:hypothetical protein [Candidatus Saccharimonadales bacterium]
MADEESKTPIEPEIKLDGLAAPDAPAQSGTPAADPPAPVEVDPLDISKTPKSFGIVKMALIIMAVIVVAAAIGVYMLLKSNADSLTSSSASPTPSPTATTKPVTPAASNAGVTLDTKKNYGNKYASGVLPVGDSKYVTTGAKKGYVYVCNANYVPASQAGAQTRGPWFTNNNTEWNVNKKAAILGKVSWQPSMSVTVQDGKRVITTNDLPSHFTGTFPVASTDPARTYDANPNTIKAQSLTYTLDGAPVVQSSPNCMGGEVGVMLTGVALFNAFDAGGRDAGAWEVQDGCDGHPQNLGEYHYHTLSRC